MPRQMPASQPRFMWAVLMLLSCPRYLAVSSQYYQCTQEKYEDKLDFFITPHQTTEWFRRGSSRWRAEREQQTPATLADYLLLYTDEIHL